MPEKPPLTDAEIKTLREHDAALRRVAAAATTAGADPADVTAARAWPLFWLLEIARRRELEPLAEIGRKVSNSRSKDSDRLIERNAEIVHCACQILLAGWKRTGRFQVRGLAGKVRSELDIDVSDKTINRILDKWMPRVFTD